MNDFFYKYSAPHGAVRDHSQTERESSDTLKSAECARFKATFEVVPELRLAQF